MAQVVFGTDRLGGLNSQAAPHLLPPDGLQKAENVDYSEHGAIKSIASSTLIEQAGGGITGAGWCELGGVSYYIYKEDDGGYSVKAYNCSTEATTTVSSSGWGAGDLQVIQADDQVILTDGTKNVIWDGTVLRGFGAPTPTYGSALDRVVVYDATEVAITGISESGGVITVSTGGISVNDGDKVWISGVTGTGNLEEVVNDEMFVVANEDGSDFELSGIDGTGLGAYTTGGTVYVNACGLTGTFKYRAGTTVTLPSGKVISGSLSVVSHTINNGAGKEDSVTLTPTKAVDVYLRGFDAADVTGWVSGSFTPGTDLTVTREAYRNKVGDTEEAYALASRGHADVYGSNALVIEDQTSDAELGGQWLGGSPAGFDSHDAPETFSCGAMHAYRLYVAVGNDMYWSNTDGPGYFKATSVVSMDEDITAIISVGDFVVAFGKYDAWLWDPVGENLKSLKIRRGVDDFHAVEKFDGRVWYANDLGLYMLDTTQLAGFSVDAVQSKPVSWPVDDEWRALDGDWSLASRHDTLYANCKQTSTSKTFVLHVGDGMKWGTLSLGEVVFHGLFSDYDNNRALYFGSTGAIKSIGTGGSSLTWTVKSPSYVTLVGQTVRLKVDMGPGASITATITTNRGKTTSVSFEGAAGRTLDYVDLEKIAGEVFEVELTGTGKLYGYKLAVDSLPGYNF